MSELLVRARAPALWNGEAIDTGGEFTLDDPGQFSWNWMEAVGWEPPEPREVAKIRHVAMPQSKKLDAIIVLLEAIASALPPASVKKVQESVRGLGFHIGDGVKGINFVRSDELAAETGMMEPDLTDVKRSGGGPQEIWDPNGITEEQLAERGKAKLV